MPSQDLQQTYRDYIDCLNARDWDSLTRFVDEAAEHNGRRLGVAGYRRMLEQDVDDIPDLHFHIELLVVQPPHVAAVLRFHCAPKGRFLGLDVDGRTVSFTEHVFYEFAEGRIVRVRSLLDKAAIEAQLGRA